MHRLIFSLLVVLALIVSPLTMASGSGMAVAHATVLAQIDSHCTGEEAPADDSNAPVKVSCASACAACLSVASVSSDNAPDAALGLVVAGPQIPSGIHPERETPPPRITSEI